MITGSRENQWLSDINLILSNTDPLWETPCVFQLSNTSQILGSGRHHNCMFSKADKRLESVKQNRSVWCEDSAEWIQSCCRVLASSLADAMVVMKPDTEPESTSPTRLCCGAYRGSHCGPGGKLKWEKLPHESWVWATEDMSLLQHAELLLCSVTCASRTRKHLNGSANTPVFYSQTDEIYCNVTI